MTNNNDKKVLKSSVEREQSESVSSAGCEKIKGSKNLNVPAKREQNDTCISSAEREEQVTEAQSKGNVPALRFPEFSGEWNFELLDTIAPNITSGKSKPSLGEYNLYGSTGIIGKTATADYSGNMLLVARVGANAGSLQLVNDNCGITDNTLIIKPCKLSSHYLYFYLQHYNLNRLVFGSGQPLITAGMLKTVRIPFGNQLEQRKIERLLLLIDMRISTQNKIIEDLKKLKSAIAEALFCTPKESMPAKRVSTYSKEWKLIKLSDISQRVQTKNTGSKCRQVLTIAAQHGLVNQEDFFNKIVASENLEGYYLLRKGDFAYNKSYSGDYAWGAVKRLDRYEQGVLSPLYICFRPDTAKVDADYLAHYFESKKWHKGIADIAGEGTRNHGLLNISVIDFFNTIHRIPDLDEQKNIAQVLNLLTFKLSCEQRVMQSLTMQRSYLLQKMFI